MRKRLHVYTKVSIVAASANLLVNAAVLSPALCMPGAALALQLWIVGAAFGARRGARHAGPPGFDIRYSMP